MTLFLFRPGGAKKILAAPKARPRPAIPRGCNELYFYRMPVRGPRPTAWAATQGRPYDAATARLRAAAPRGSGDDAMKITFTGVIGDVARSCVRNVAVAAPTGAPDVVPSALKARLRGGLPLGSGVPGRSIPRHAAGLLLPVSAFPPFAGWASGRSGHNLLCIL